MTTASRASTPTDRHTETAAAGRCLQAAAALALCAILPAFTARPAQAAPAAEVLVRVEQPTDIDPQWQAHLCTLLPQPCKPDTLSLYRPRAAAPEDYVVLGTSPLALARLRRSGSTWQAVSTHDFTAYRHSMTDAPQDPDADTASPATLRLAPALYPLGPGRWAAAVLWTTTASYSGGGAGHSTADFVALDAPAGTARATHAGIPFSCSVVIRACFSEKDYAQSPHCHDETTGSLRIGYQEGVPGSSTGSTAPGEFRWRFTWAESSWPAHQPASSARRTTQRFSDESADSVSFCEGS